MTKKNPVPVETWSLTNRSSRSQSPETEMQGKQASFMAEKMVLYLRDLKPVGLNLNNKKLLHIFKIRNYA